MNSDTSDGALSEGLAQLPPPPGDLSQLPPPPPPPSGSGEGLAPEQMTAREGVDLSTLPPPPTAPPAGLSYDDYRDARIAAKREQQAEKARRKAEERDRRIQQEAEKKLEAERVRAEQAALEEARKQRQEARKDPSIQFTYDGLMARADVLENEALELKAAGLIEESEEVLKQARKYRKLALRLSTASFAGVKLSGKTISYRGQSWPVEGVRAYVETAGEIDRRGPITRAVLLGGIGAIAFKKKVDKRELYLGVEGPGFGFVVEVDPDKGAAARKFATAVNAAGSTTSSTSETAGAISASEPSQGSASAGDHGSDLVSRLERLESLLRSGALSEEEYAVAKSKVLEDGL